MKKLVLIAILAITTLGWGFDELSNPFYYDGHGKMSANVEYELFQGLRKCYGDLQAQRHIDGVQNGTTSFTTLQNMVNACKRGL